MVHEWNPLESKSGQLLRMPIICVGFVNTFIELHPVFVYIVRTPREVGK